MVETGRAAINNIANNSSWFRGTPHYWATASLPIAYAVACVEVVSKTSDKAGAIYRQANPLCVLYTNDEIRGKGA